MDRPVATLFTGERPKSHARSEARNRSYNVIKINARAVNLILIHSNARNFHRTDTTIKCYVSLPGLTLGDLRPFISQLVSIGASLRLRPSASYLNDYDLFYNFWEFFRTRNSRH